MNFKFLLMPAVALFTLATVATSCSDDNDEPGGTAEMPIPSSVVDGTRISRYGSDITINYNADGSISSAKYDGDTYTFEYAESGRAAEFTGRTLVRVSYERDYEKFEATDFRFNAQGFVTTYKETFEENYSGDYYKEVIEHVFTYNGDGRLARINSSITATDGVHSMSDNNVFALSYNGGKLVGAIGESSYSKETVSFEYDGAPDNTYNITPKNLCPNMGMSDLLRILGYAGYLGNSSAQLPTKVTSVIIDKEDSTTENEVDSYSYSLDRDNMVTSITEHWSNGGSKTYDISYWVK